MTPHLIAVIAYSLGTAALTLGGIAWLLHRQTKKIEAWFDRLDAASKAPRRGS